MPQHDRFFKIIKTTVKGAILKEKMKDEHFDVALMRKCAECGSDNEIMWLELHPSQGLP